jgi:hypothetical protein
MSEQTHTRSCQCGAVQFDVTMALEGLIAEHGHCAGIFVPKERRQTVQGMCLYHLPYTKRQFCL